MSEIVGRPDSRWFREIASYLWQFLNPAYFNETRKHHNIFSFAISQNDKVWVQNPLMPSAYYSHTYLADPTKYGFIAAELFLYFK